MNFSRLLAITARIYTEGHSRTAHELFERGGQSIRRVLPERLPPFIRISSTDWVEGGWALEQAVELARNIACAWRRSYSIALGEATSPTAKILIGPRLSGAVCRTHSPRCPHTYGRCGHDYRTRLRPTKSSTADRRIWFCSLARCCATRIGLFMPPRNWAKQSRGRPVSSRGTLSAPPCASVPSIHVIGAFGNARRAGQCTSASNLRAIAARQDQPRVRRHSRLEKAESAIPARRQSLLLQLHLNLRGGPVVDVFSSPCPSSRRAKATSPGCCTLSTTLPSAIRMVVCNCVRYTTT